MNSYKIEYTSSDIHVMQRRTTLEDSQKCSRPEETEENGEKIEARF